MGTEAVWIPLALSALGAGASYYNTQQTAKRQDNQLAAQLRGQADLQHQADAKTAALIQNQQKSTDTGDKAKSLGLETQAIAQHQAGATNQLAAPGAVSAAYNKAGSDAALGINTYGGNFANLTSSMDAPGQQRQRDQFTIDKYQNDIGQLARQNQGNNFLANMRLRGIRRNPWIDAASQAASSYGSNYGAGSTAAATSDPTYSIF